MSEQSPIYDELLGIVGRQQRQIDALLAESARLRAELDQGRRSAKRRAGPFAKRPPKADPKQPGRETGYRPTPPPESAARGGFAPLAADRSGCARPLTRPPTRCQDQPLTTKIETLDGRRRRIIKGILRSTDRLGEHWGRYERQEIVGNATSRLAVLDEIEVVRRRIERLGEMLGNI